MVQRKFFDMLFPSKSYAKKSFNNNIYQKKIPYCRIPLKSKLIIKTLTAFSICFFKTIHIDKVASSCL